MTDMARKDYKETSWLSQFLSYTKCVILNRFMQL